MITRVTSQDFEDKVLKSDLPVFACFTTSWCRSCFALCLVIEDLARHYKQRIRFVEVDAEDAPELVERYHLRALPAVLLFKGGKPVKKLLGFRSRAPLKNLLDMLAARKQEDV
ncbi:MAG: thiol reductase thioredoxin [Dehalococcoidia bacterium]|nr:thiol reductase thioredoxin [Dehalococcoidia bacterium]